MSQPPKKIFIHVPIDQSGIYGTNKDIVYTTRAMGGFTLKEILEETERNIAEADLLAHCHAMESE